MFWKLYTIALQGMLVGWLMIEFFLSIVLERIWS